MYNRLKRSFISKTFLNYGLIGVTGVLLDFGVYAVLVKLGIHPIIASAISVTIGITNNYYWNARYNFKVKDKYLKRFASFYGVGGIGIILTSLILFICHDTLGMSPIISKIISIPPVVGVQFLLNKKISFGGFRFRHLTQYLRTLDNNHVIKLAFSRFENAVLVLSVICFAVLLVVSLLFTLKNWWSFQEMNTASQVILCVGGTLLVLISAKLLAPQTSRISNRLILIFTLGFHGILGLGYILLTTSRGVYTSDPAVLLAAPVNIEYLTHFPHQIPYHLLTKVSIHSFGYEGGILLLNILNLLAIQLIILSVYKITTSVFNDKLTTTYSMVLMAPMLFFVYYIPFIYGDLLGIALLVFGISRVLDNIKQTPSVGIYSHIFTVIIFVTAILMKSSLIVVVAIVFLTLFYKSVLMKSVHSGVLYVGSLVAIICSSIVIQAGLLSIYHAHYTQMSMNKEVPKVAWIAMGLQAGTYHGIEFANTSRSIKDLDTVAPGMWNEYLTSIYNQSTYDMSMTSQESIINSIRLFSKDPGYALQFFIYKGAYQWADPLYDTRTYLSSNNELLGIARWTNIDSSKASRLLMELNNNESETRRSFIYISDALQTVLYSMVLVYILFLIRLRCKNTLHSNQDVGAFVLLISIVSGLMMYVLWEAAPRYAIPYVVLMVPLAARGLVYTSKFSLQRLR